MLTLTTHIKRLIDRAKANGNKTEVTLADLRFIKEKVDLKNKMINQSKKKWRAKFEKAMMRGIWK